MKLFLMFAILFSFSSYAEERVPMEDITFKIESANAAQQLEGIFKNPQGILTRFKPQIMGAKITNKKVYTNSTSYNATLKILMVTKTFFINTILDTNDDYKGCPGEEKGYTLTFNFDNSDAIITDNIDRVEANLCVNQVSATHAITTVHPTIFKANTYSSITGPTVLKVAAAQVAPIIAAMNEELAGKN